MKHAALVVLCACPSAQAARIARTLVRERHAACVNLVPKVRSVYRWKGRVRTDTETLLVIKTPAAGFARLKAALLKLHPYELPEVIAVKIALGHTAYLHWIHDACA